MSSSRNSPPAKPSRRLNAGWVALVLALVLAAPALANPMPDYLRDALARFNPDVPPGWAYTLTTTRNEVRMVERFDPSLPPAARWSLLEWQGRPPTADEREKYLRSRPPGDSGGARANFKKADIEPGSLTLQNENDAFAEFTGRFRDVAASADKMLGRLTLRLVADKRSRHIAEYGLTLPEPYSPVLAVKMHRLDVTVRYHPPTLDRPALPASHSSRFAGRILFVSSEENLDLVYSDYAAASPELSR